jgi:hypothetical protein
MDKFTSLLGGFLCWVALATIVFIAGALLLAPLTRNTGPTYSSTTYKSNRQEMIGACIERAYQKNERLYGTRTASAAEKNWCLRGSR